MCYRLFLRSVALLLLAGLLLPSCTLTPVDPTDTTAEESLTEAPTAPSVTEPATAPETTEAPSAPVETEAPEDEPVTEPADGIFDTPTRLSGFLQSKNEDYIEGTDCTIVYGEDGVLTLTAQMLAGKHLSAKVAVDYARMMKKCYPSYTASADLPNGGSDQYRAIVITIEGEAEQLCECNLYFSTGARRTSEHTILPEIATDPAAGRTYLLFDMGETFTEDYLNKLTFTWAYGTADTDTDVAMKLHSIELFSSVETAVETLKLERPAAVEDYGNYPLDVSRDKLSELMSDIFSGDTVKNETVMFLDKGDEKELLYDIDTVLSVTSYDGKRVYKEGVDYEVRDGKLVALKGGSIPTITRAAYYGANSSNSILQTEYNGQNVYTHWGEGTAMTNWQVNVSYTHKDPWDGFDQPCQAEIYANFIRKLQNGEDVTIIYYGDSCTFGAASSFTYGYAPYQYSYTLLVTNALADLFGYTVKYVSTGLPDTGPIPSRPYVAGTNGTITYINPSVGGWNSSDAYGHADRYLLPFIEKYGCDLFVLDIGGNDGTSSGERTRRNDEGTIGKVLSVADEDICVCIMTTLVNNPDATNGWYGIEFMQEPYLLQASAALRRKGVACGTCCMTSLTLSALEHVKYNDISGNNINHPNDFFARMYACTLFENLIGYENLQ